MKKALFRSEQQPLYHRVKCVRTEGPRDCTLFHGNLDDLEITELTDIESLVEEPQ